MRIIKDVTVYQCEFCGKKQYRKCDMSLHEKWCKKNPANDHKCFQHCVHLIKGREQIDDGREFSSSRCTFQCNVTKKFMYSSIAERRKIVPLLENVERMPLKCPFYVDKMNAEHSMFDSEPISNDELVMQSIKELNGKTYNK